MKVLFLHKYGQGYATYRSRLALFLPGLRARGIDCVVSTLVERDGDSLFSIAGRAFRHAELLARLRDFDLVVLYHELSPYLPATAERAILGSGVPYVYDFDDALYLLETRLTRGKIASLIEGASGVIAGSQELATYAQRFNSEVTLVPTVVDLARYSRGSPARESERAGAPFTIGWIGVPGTAHYLIDVAEPLRRLTASRGARLVTVGAGPFELPGVRHESRPWNEHTELKDLLSFDAGIMPLTDDEWSRGKCGFKLVQYHAIGIPSVASPVGANRSIVEDGVTGLLARTPGDWVAALERLADDASLRERMGRAARARAARFFSLSSVEPQFHAALLRAAGRSGSSQGGGAQTA